MVPLRLDVYDSCPPKARPTPRPTLILKDLSASPLKSRTRRNPWTRLENWLVAAALAAVVLFFLVSTALSLVHLVQQNYATTVLPAVVTIPKTVVRGDTLAKLAEHYGNPSVYILEREDQIARANHLSGTTPLVPGQHLQIPVTNPTVIAQIVRNSNHRLVASR